MKNIFRFTGLQSDIAPPIKKKRKGDKIKSNKNVTRSNITLFSYVSTS